MEINTKRIIELVNAGEKARCPLCEKGYIMDKYNSKAFYTCTKCEEFKLIITKKI